MNQLAGFALYLLQSGCSDRTTQIRLGCMRRILLASPSLDEEECASFLLSLKRDGRKNSYINTYIESLRKYGEYEGRGRFSRLKLWKKEVTIKATMSDEEVERFLSLPPPKRSFSNYAMYSMFFAVLAYSGMRPNECATLKVDQVDFARRVFILYSTKSDPREVPISPVIYDRLYTYVQNLLGEYLFSLKGKPIDKMDWMYQFNKRVKTMGIKRTNLTTYSLRHSFATRLADADVNLYRLQAVLGHKLGSAVTAVYYHRSTKALQQTIKKDPLGLRAIPTEEKAQQYYEMSQKYGVIKQFEQAEDEVVIRIKLR